MTAAADLAEALDDIADIWLSPRLAERVIAQLEDKGWNITRKLAPLPSTDALHQSMLDEINRERGDRRTARELLDVAWEEVPIDLHLKSCTCRLCVAEQVTP